MSTENPQSQAINEFGNNVFIAITAANDGNNVISPLSLSAAMGMVLLGAKQETNTELRKVLRYDKYNIADSDAHNAYLILSQQMICENSNHYVLYVANGVMMKNDFDVLDDYSDQLQINYDASVQYADFAYDGHYAIDTINNFVAINTRCKIAPLFTAQLPVDSSLVIVNAVYFKGKWLHKFHYESTKRDTFHNNGNTNTNTKVSVEMMLRGHTYYNFTDSEELDADIVEMPYIGGHISMFIVLPHTLMGLQKTASVLSEEKLNSAIKSMKYVCTNLYLPKFKIKLLYKLKNKLKSLGLIVPFTDNADFSVINGQRDLKLSDVVHKVFLVVNESGTESAATTCAKIRLTGGRPTPREFKVDHPFIVVIRDNRNDVNLFYGQITEL